MTDDSTDSCHIETHSEHQHHHRGWLSSCYSSMPKWKPTSSFLLEEVENRMLNSVKSPLRKWFVTLRNGENIRTVQVLHEDSNKTPLVLLHGFGGGLGLWVMNLDYLSRNRSVYACDVLGFGRSSRPNFPKQSDRIIDNFVDSIEEWRENVGLEKFVLVGHSFGGYLSFAYAIKHPERVEHLVLADPWGFPQRPDNFTPSHFPIWARAMAKILKPFSLLAPVRGAGPLGPSLVRRMRPDLRDKFNLFKDDTIFNYIYHCNAQKPSGEIAFQNITLSFGWARDPMIRHIHLLSDAVPITFIYGSLSWMDSETGEKVKDIRVNSYTDVQVVKGAGHHVYADAPNLFNEAMDRLLEFTDDNEQSR